MQTFASCDALLMGGGPYERGKAQGEYADRTKVVRAIQYRLEQNKLVLARPVVQDFLRRQWEFASVQCRDELAEMEGVSDAFNMNAASLFEFLHLGIVRNIGAPVIEDDGCSTWAVSRLAEGPAVGKNRDFLGEHAGLQAVFLHQDQGWADARAVLCVGSLGCPGTYSSGINSCGLAVVDTHIATPDYGIGWLRYFLMTRLLSQHRDVASALKYIKSIPHAGGGSLILGDPGGRIAAVDLGHASLSIVERNNGWLARTNHFDPGSVANLHEGKPLHGSTLGRRKTLVHALSQKSKTLSGLTRLMQTHSSVDNEGLCRHNEDGDGWTLSGVIFLCQSRILYFSNGNPCSTDWGKFSIS